MLHSDTRERRRRVRLGVPLLSVAMFAASFAATASAQTTPRLFDAPVSLEAIGTPDCILDLDGDGNRDLLLAGFNASAVVVSASLGTGTGDFGTSWNTSTPWPITPPATLGVTEPAHQIERASLNADGRDDFAFAIGNTITAWIAAPAGPATVAWSWTLPFECRRLAIGDFDGNGLDDIAALLAGSSVTILYSTPGAGPPISASINGYAGIVDFCAVEIDGDGRPDLVLGSSLGVLTGISVATSSPVIVFSTGYPGSTVRALLPGDWDGDADLDLRVVMLAVGAAPLFPGYSSALLRRTGPTTLVPEPLQALTPGLNSYPGVMSFHLAAGDGNGDGFPDLAAVIAPGVWVFPGSATTLQTGGLIDIPIGLGILRAADLDNDGRSDLVLRDTIVRGEAGRGWLLESGPGITLDRNPVDYDGDGDPDLDLGKPGAALVSATYPGPSGNDGSGVFTPAPDPLPALPAGLAYDGPGYVGDFDGDGGVDVLANCTQAGAPQASRFLRNLGGGSFADLGPVVGPGVSLGAFPYVIAARTVPASSVSGLAADVDGDGDLDLVARDPGQTAGTMVPATSRVWINSGLPGFVAGPAFPTVYVHAVAELTGDSVPDLVGIMTATGGGLPHSVVVIAGTGGGGFANPLFATLLATTTAVASSAVVPCVAVGDVDGDNQPDVITALAGNNPMIHRRLPGGWSTTVLTGAPGWTNATLWLTDATGDGRTDIVAADTRTRIWAGSSTGPGGMPRTYTLSPTLVADLDGDGDVDALTSTGLYRGAVFRPPTNGRRLQQYAGLAGSGGLVPILGAGGAVRGGSTITLRLTNAVGGAPAVLALGSAAASTPLFGGTLYLSPDLLLPFTLGGPLGAVGEGRFAVPATLPSSFVGMQVVLQAGVGDAGAVQGVSLTNALTLTVGI